MSKLIMSKLKTLKESRAAVFAKIDELRTATDGREMTSEEQERWNTLLAEYEQADRAVEAEERYVDIERRQAEQQYARQTSGEQPDECRADTDAKATVVAEYQQSTKSAPSFGSETLKAYTYRTPIVPVSLELLQDSAFDLESLLSGLLAESFGRGINYDLTRGDGKGKPKGIVEWAHACAVSPSGNGISLDALIELIKGVDSSYARHGRFMFNRNTLYSLVKIKDTTGRYIWQEGAKDGTPPTLFGKAYILNDDLDDAAAGKTSVLFGDLSKFKIRMVKSFRVIRLNELLAEYLSIGLFGFARVDGILLDAGTHPVHKLVHKSA